MKKTIIAWMFALIIGLGMISYTSASNWYRNNPAYISGTNSWSTSFVDTDNDWVCDNYKNRPMDGTWKGQWRGQGKWMGRHK